MYNFEGQPVCGNLGVSTIPVNTHIPIAVLIAVKGPEQAFIRIVLRNSGNEPLGFSEIMIR
jgi:hypothetical protein